MILFTLLLPTHAWTATSSHSPKHPSSQRSTLSLILLKINDIKQNVNKLHRAIQRQNQRLDNMQHLLTQLNQHSPQPYKFQPIHRQTPRQRRQPLKAQQAYQQILHALHHKNFTLAQQKLNHFLTAYPQDSHHPNAIYWLGSIFVIQGQWSAAMKQFLDLVQHYSHHPQTPYAMLRIGLLYKETGQKQRAHLWFNRLRKHAPHCPAIRATPRGF